MTLPHWIEQDIRRLPENFTGQIILECWSGGVTRRDFIQPPDRRTAPEITESRRHVLSAYDNRRANLRSCSHTENIRNQVRTQSSKTSKYKGVMWSTRYEKWESQIKADKKKYYLGRFNNEESAASAYNAAALRLHGEFASLNSLA